MLRRQSGFGLVEIMVAIVLMGAVSLGLATIYRSLLYIQAAAQHQKSATLAAHRQVESLRNSNYNNLTAGSTITFTSSLPAELPKPKTGTATISEPISGLKRVDVTVSYTYQQQTKQVKVSSMIGVIGISQ